MYKLNKITFSIRVALLALILSLVSTGSFVAVAHASGQMDMMNDCARTCLLQQSPVAASPEEREFNEQDDEAEPHKATPAIPFYVQFQRVYTPQNLRTTNNRLIATFRPPDILVMNSTLRF